jgi:glycosyltransferase involved in cell wall biosynthesis
MKHLGKAYRKFSLVLQMNVIPDYRIGFLRTLKQRLSADFQIYSGWIDYATTTQTAPDAPSCTPFITLKNHFFFGRRFLWQSGHFLERLRADVLIANFNLRTVSNYPILLLRWLFRRPTLLWGHVTGLSPISMRFGFLQLFFAKGFICYTHTQQSLFQQYHPYLPTQTFVAANSCVHAADCYFNPQSEQEIRDVVFVGRLVKEKKPMLLLQAFIMARRQGLLPAQTRLVFVGRGPQADELRSAASTSEYSNEIHFTGHVADIHQLRSIYSTAFCSVNPGYIGLSVIQSFAFGVPVLAADKEPHSPEVEACQKIRFGEFFTTNSPDKLAICLGEYWQRRATTRQQRPAIIEYIRNHYTYETMTEGFIHAIQSVLNRKSNGSIHAYRTML